MDEKRINIRDWKLIKKIDTGGHSEVWLVKGNDKQFYAAKILNTKDANNEKLYHRFINEIKTQKDLMPYDIVLPIIDDNLEEVKANSSRAWFIMPEATPLSKIQHSTDNFIEKVQIIRQIVFALKTMHELGYSHRDIKPENIFKYNGKIVIGDFGISFNPNDVRLTNPHEKLGPTYYIAPEMLNNSQASDGQCADIYSLAKLFWKIVSGYRFPLPGVHRCNVSSLTLSCYTTDKRAILLDGLIDRCTNIDPKQRPTASEVLYEIDYWLSPKVYEMHDITIPTFTDVKKRIIDANNVKHEDSKIQATEIQYLGKSVRELFEENGKLFSSKSDLDYVPHYGGINPIEKNPSYHLNNVHEQVDRQGAGFCLMISGEPEQERVHIEFCSSQIGNNIYASIELIVCNGPLSDPKNVEKFWDDHCQFEKSMTYIDGKITQYKVDLIKNISLAIIKFKERLNKIYIRT